MSAVSALQQESIDVIDEAAEVEVSAPPEDTALSDDPPAIALMDFIEEFKGGLLDAVTAQNPPVYNEIPNPARAAVMDRLLRKPFPAQARVVQIVSRLLVDHGAPAAVINAEMGTGKTQMANSLAAVLHAEGYRRTLVLSPPHLVYKWRREILQTVPNARVWVLNGPDTLAKLILFRSMLRAQSQPSDQQEFYVLGRVRMRMGFHWRPCATRRRVHTRDDVDGIKQWVTIEYAACPKCGQYILNADGGRIPYRHFIADDGADRRMNCTHLVGEDKIMCNEPLWTLMRPAAPRNLREQLADKLCEMPTIGPKRAERLIAQFGEQPLYDMLSDNLYEFVNLMDDDGHFVFADRQATRIEKALGQMELGFGQGGYQATEFVKRYLPNGFFDLLIADEGHEYKNGDSAQGQAMGVLASKARKVVLLTGTLMGGYADDLFYLLWRMMPQVMIDDGFHAVNGRMGTASMSFLRDHGVLIDVYKEIDGGSHKTAKGKKTVVSTKRGPGFGPKGIARFVVPFTVFLKLKEIGGNVLPPYTERYEEITMTGMQRAQYASLERTLRAELAIALRVGDHSLLGVVLNTLLAWPDCAFRDELVRHPRTKRLLASAPAVFEFVDDAPKETRLLEICKAERARGRRVLVYTVYTGTRDTTTRIKSLLETHDLRAAVLRASVEASARENWIAEQVDKGIDVLITNPELVKTGLDLLEFPTIVYMTTGYNVYTLQQASRRSWRIGQQEPVDVYFLGYENSAQTACLGLMAKKIAVSQSTSGDVPDSGLDILNQDGDSIEVALAKRLLAA